MRTLMEQWYDIREEEAAEKQRMRRQYLLDLFIALAMGFALALLLV
jgi:hypothetical protein